MVAVSMVLLLGIMALVFDLGLLMRDRRRAQASADASALAAIYAYNKDPDASGSIRKAGATEAARRFAAANGFTNGVGGATVTVNLPPISGAFATKQDYAEVIIGGARPRFFSGIWGRTGLTTGARAVARGVTDDAEAALILLDPGRSGALALAGSGRIVTDAGIQVNSNHPQAVTASNTGHTSPQTSSKLNTPVIKVAGGYSLSSGGYLAGRVVTGASTMADPLASLPAPPATGTTYNGLPFPNYGTRTMSPGVYNGGVNIGGGMNITMQPGTYYMKGGDFTIANGATVSGSGVFIYVDSGGGKVNFQGGGIIKLSPPTSGTYAGITIYQDRNSTQNISIANGTTTTITGTFYAPSARVSYAGGASYNQSATKMIVKSLDISNNAYVGVGGSNTGGSSITYALVE